MEFLRHLKEGGRGYLVVFLFILGALLLFFAARGDDRTEEKRDDRVPDADTKRALEKELEELIGAMEGVGAVRVRLSLESGSEYVYENGKNTLILAGRVRGVAVVCDGGDDPVKKEKIITLLCALLDLPMKSVAVWQ